MQKRLLIIFGLIQFLTPVTFAAIVSRSYSSSLKVFVGILITIYCCRLVEFAMVIYDPPNKFIK